MSDPQAPKRQRSAINALKILNKLRQDRALPKAKTKLKVSNKPKKILITAEIKEAITLQEIQHLFPAALTEANYVFNEEQNKKLVKEVEFRLARIRSGKDEAPAVTAASAKTAGRAKKPAK
jgi:hypothetical protein